MNNKITLLCITCALLLAGQCFLPGCKKGEDDPTISLRTRKARITGQWSMESATWTQTDTTTTYDGQTLLITYPDSLIDTLMMQLTWKFGNENTYEEIKTTDFPTNWHGNNEPAFSMTETNLGTWKFTGGGAVPEKSQLLLQVTQASLTSSNTQSNIDMIDYDGQPEGFVYDIKRLSNTDMVLTYNLTITSPAGTFTRTAELNLVKQ